MKTALIMTTRAFSSDFKSLYEQMAFMREEYDQIFLVHAYTTERVKKYIEETAGIHINKSFSISEDLNDIGIKHLYKTWEEYYNAIDTSMFNDVQIDDVWMFGAPLSEGGALKRGMLGLEKSFYKHSYMKFLSVAKLYMIMYFALRVANDKGARFREMCYDPCEASVNELTNPTIVPKSGYDVYHGYNLPEYGMQKHTAYQDGLTRVGKLFPFASKDYDLTFGYSYMTFEREKDHLMMQRVYQNLEGKVTGKLLHRSKPDDFDSLVSKDEYMSLIAESRYTFILPAYKENAFSCYRFIESIFYDCLPLVFDHCKYQDFFASYGIDQTVIEEIIINESNVLEKLNMPESRRTEIIEYMKEKLF